MQQSAINEDLAASLNISQRGGLSYILNSNGDSSDLSSITKLQKKSGRQELPKILKEQSNKLLRNKSILQKFLPNSKTSLIKQLTKGELFKSQTGVFSRQSSLIKRKSTLKTDSTFKDKAESEERESSANREAEEHHESEDDMIDDHILS